MTQYQKKAAVIDAITFDELVAHGLANAASVGQNGMPWSWHYMGHPITHENDNCYLIPTPNGTAKLWRGDMLCAQTVNGKIDLWPVAGEIFAATYERAAPTKRQRKSLRHTVEEYAEAARVIHLHLRQFCDESLNFPDMIAEAARRAAAKLNVAVPAPAGAPDGTSAERAAWWEAEARRVMTALVAEGDSDLIERVTRLTLSLRPDNEQSPPPAPDVTDEDVARAVEVHDSALMTIDDADEMKGVQHVSRIILRCVLGDFVNRRRTPATRAAPSEKPVWGGPGSQRSVCGEE